MSSSEIPRFLAAELTARCHRSCAYCYNAFRSGAQPPDLSTDEWIELIDSALDQSGLTAVQLTGGEPLLHEGFFEIAEHLRKQDRRVSVVTDGGPITDEVADNLKRLGIGPIQPTLLSADRVTHDRLKNADGAFDETIDAILRLRQREIPVSVAFVATRLNADHLPAVIELCFSLGIRTVAFSRLCTTGEAVKHADLQPTPDQIRRCLHVANEANARLGMRIQVAISLPHCLTEALPNLPLGRCALTTDTPGYTIAPTGHLKACSISPTNLGNLRTEPWQDILTRAKKTYFPDLTALSEACTNCDQVKSCGAGCRESAAVSASKKDPLIKTG